MLRKTVVGQKRWRQWGQRSAAHKRLTQSRTDRSLCPSFNYLLPLIGELLW